MKNKLILIIIGGIVLLTALIFSLTLIKNSPSYLNIIEKNWGLTLPKNCKETFQADSGADFHGDGLRFHIFEYDADIPLNDQIPEQTLSENDIESVSSILSRLNVDKALYPNFKSITHAAVQKHSDNSTMYLCYSTLQKTLYIIESFQ